jgi:hypothetical protein
VVHTEVLLVAHRAHIAECVLARHFIRITDVRRAHREEKHTRCAPVAMSYSIDVQDPASATSLPRVPTKWMGRREMGPRDELRRRASSGQIQALNRLCGCWCQTAWGRPGCFFWQNPTIERRILAQNRKQTRRGAFIQMLCAAEICP